MSTWNFVINFEGLICFVPWLERVDHAKQQFYALLVGTGHGSHEHHPAFTFNPADVLVDPSGSGRIDLHDDVIEVDTSFAPSPEIKRPRPPLGGAKEPEPANRHSFEWIADLTQVHGRAPDDPLKFKRECTADDPSGSGISARLDVAHGMVTTKDFARLKSDNQLDTPEWQFAERRVDGTVDCASLSGYSQAIASKVSCTIAVPAGHELSVGLRKFADPPGHHHTTLRFRPYLGKTVVVQVSNLSHDSEPVPSTCTFDPHFHLVYDLLDGGGGLRKFVPARMLSERDVEVIKMRDGDPEGQYFCASPGGGCFC